MIVRAFIFSTTSRSAAEEALDHVEPGGGHSKRVCALRSSARYGRFLKETTQGLAIDRQAIAELERFDGKFVVHSNDDTLTAEDMALGYKQQSVEEAWPTMKSGLRMRPVFHWAPHRIHAHIAITVLALLLERVIEHACKDTWRNIRDDLKRSQLAQLSSPNGTVWQVTEPTAEAAKRLKDLKIKPPPAILKLDCARLTHRYTPVSGPQLDVLRCAACGGTCYQVVSNSGASVAGKAATSDAP